MSHSTPNYPYLGGGILCPPHKFFPMLHWRNLMSLHIISPCNMGGILCPHIKFSPCNVGEILCPHA